MNSSGGFESTGTQSNEFVRKVSTGTQSNEFARIVNGNPVQWVCPESQREPSPMGSSGKDSTGTQSNEFAQNVNGNLVQWVRPERFVMECFPRVYSSAGD